MKILIAGGSGFVGTALGKHLSTKHELTLLSRTKKTGSKIYDYTITWDELSTSSIKNYKIIINLCGYNIGQSRWSKSVKDKIISSRIEPTQILIDLIGDKDIWLINASAIGFYNFSREIQNESRYIINGSKQGFSQEVVAKLENVLIKSELQKYTILRFGVVIGTGGVLEKIIMTVKLGVLVKFASGKQIMSWISMFDLVKVFEFVIENDYFEKEVFNLTAPNVTSNLNMIESIKKITRVKLVMFVPKIVIKLMLGQMGEELLLSNQNIYPKRLIEKGFKFHDINIDSALERYL